ncbi:MAG TPA: S8 family serine peptidase, partial [Vicinamibacterales bacterium]|nr:S8 family serine peptidase [Vicinamibacterales bacterium]
MVELEGDTIPPELRRIFTPRTVAGRVVTGNILVRDIETLNTIPGLKRAERARILAHELDRALPDARVARLPNGEATRRGNGVIVGVIDHGIDFRHDSFLKGNKTRILAIWDQALVAENGETVPQPFGYGVEYTQETIDRALAPEPTATVRHADPPPFHGTHVAGIAAGNGRPSLTGEGVTRFVGLAPDAELIIVANTRARTQDPGSMGDSADTLDAVKYIVCAAERLGGGKPVAINMSEGDNIGPHDGTSLLEVGIKNLLEEKPGRVLIKSAGNEGDTAHHAEGDLEDGVAQELHIQVPRGEQDLIVDIWYPAADLLGLTILSPAAASTQRFVPAFSDVVALADGTEVFVDANVDLGNGDNRTFVALRAPQGFSLPSGTWTFRLDGVGHWHAWIQRDSPAIFQPPFVSRAATVSIPGTNQAIISVASHISNNDFADGDLGSLSEFSGRGPTRRGDPAPTLSAPGEEITGPQPGGNFVGMSGTSMSAAMVTGAAALLLEINP